MAKPTTEKPPLAPLESSEEEQEGLVSRRAKKKKQMAQSAKVSLLTNYWNTKNLKNIGLSYFMFW